MLKPSLVKESFAYVESDAGKATAYFYGRLFASNPEMRALFPLAMDRQREHFFHALSQLVWSLDCPEQMAAFLREVGRDHRRFGVTAKHYPEFMAALMATVREFAGPAWSDEAAEAWQAVLDVVTRTMLEAADADAKHAPSWWLAEVVAHERRAEDLAVLIVRPDQPLDYRPGQYVSVQSARWPREWRNYSIANAPRKDGSLTLHVRAICGGLVSTALVQHTGPGDTLLLGPAKGSMTLPAEPPRDLLCVAGGTGLAPVKAIVEEITGGPAASRRREIVLYHGARREADLYDLASLQHLELNYPWLQVIPVVSEEAAPDAIFGSVPDVVGLSSWRNRDIYVAGPDDMIARTVSELKDRGAPPERIHYDCPLF